MSANSTHEFPARVGGVPDAFDFLPFIVFAALYASLIPIVVWRMAHPRSRTTVLIGTSGFTIERYVPLHSRPPSAPLLPAPSPQSVIIMMAER
uniref:Uncharacterized protein n=1 Tax=Ganoderma boninense TaxID=34458 RepID=A0A5K1K2M1_9APHY|nr:Uncharacterized protein [Ganoderma boninense]